MFLNIIRAVKMNSCLCKLVISAPKKLSCMLISSYLHKINLAFARRNIKNLCNMCGMYSGEVKVAENEVNLDLTLLGGQSFRWEKKEHDQQTQWCGVVKLVYWELSQTASSIKYKAYPMTESNLTDDEYYNAELRSYLRLDFDLNKYMQQWTAAHPHFAQVSSSCNAVRMLNQEPLENIISFMCSQNNNIKRISSMIQWLCINLGYRIYTYKGHKAYAFPALEELVMNIDVLEEKLRNAKFGYRAKFITAAVKKIDELGGYAWFEQLKKMSYEEARNALVELPGIGFKVADCICLMSLNHLQAVPIDTHIYQIACMHYTPHLVSNNDGKKKNITRKIYEEMAEKFREVYGPYAGWAQTVLFCSHLPQFQESFKKETKIKCV